MSAFNRFCAKARQAVLKVSDRAEELVDSASKSVKVKSLEIRMDEQYENLGRLIYRDLHTDEDLEEEKLEIIAAIDALYDELALLKGEREEPQAEAESDAAEAAEAADDEGDVGEEDSDAE